MPTFRARLLQCRMKRSQVRARRAVGNHLQSCFGRCQIGSGERTPADSMQSGPEHVQFREQYVMWPAAATTRVEHAEGWIVKKQDDGVEQVADMQPPAWMFFQRIA